MVVGIPNYKVEYSTTIHPGGSADGVWDLGVY